MTQQGQTDQAGAPPRRTVSAWLSAIWATTMGGIGWLLSLLVRGYQVFISPLFGPTCRFYPSCSSYAITALRVHGPFMGVYLTVRRLLRCHPWNPGGVDDVPPKRRSDAGPCASHAHQ